MDKHDLCIMLTNHLLKTKNTNNPKIKKTGDSRYIYQNKLKLAFNMIWPMEIVRIFLEEQFLIVLHDKVLNIAKSPKYDVYQRGLAWIVYFR